MTAKEYLQNKFPWMKLHWDEDEIIDDNWIAEEMEAYHQAKIPNPPISWRDEFIEEFYKTCTYTQRITTGDEVEMRPTAFKWAPNQVANWLYNHLQPPPSPGRDVIEFVESCGTLTEYVDGDKIDHRFKDHTIPVIEFNELRDAAKLWSPTPPLKAATPPDQGWMSVNDKMPESGRCVMIFSVNGGVAEGSYLSEKKHWCQWRWNAIQKNVTHWMPLPEFQNPNPPPSLGGEYSIDRLELVGRLARRYRFDALGVAELCDNVLDRTGKLLGEVRQKHREDKS
jgi:hypothetical protein